MLKNIRTAAFAGGLALLAALTAVAFLPAAPASAAAQKVYVTPIIGSEDFCRAGKELAKWRYTFTARITRKNAPAPKQVKVVYAVVDQQTGATVVDQTLVLRPRRYFRSGALAEYTAGHDLVITATVSFKSPLTGHTLSQTSSIRDRVPMDIEMDQMGASLPACA